MPVHRLNFSNFELSVGSFVRWLTRVVAATMVIALFKRTLAGHQDFFIKIL